MINDFYSYIEKCLDEHELPHAFLLETNEVEKTVDEIGTFLYKKKLFHQALLTNNLNFLLIEPDGKEIKTNQIELLQNRLSTKPINDNYNVYIIKNADKMNISAANKLLKFLEEPADLIIGILVADFGSPVLETISSRCQSFKIKYNNSNEIDEKVVELLKIKQNINFEQKVAFKNAFLALERAEIINIIQKGILTLEADLINVTASENPIITNIIILDKALHLLKSNVNIELVLDKLCIEMR